MGGSPRDKRITKLGIGHGKVFDYLKRIRRAGPRNVSRPMIQRIILAFASLSIVSICSAASEVQKVAVLPGIVELRVLDEKTIFLKSPDNQMLNPMPFSHGEDRRFVQGGVIKVSPNARKPNEMTIKVGEEASNVTRFGGDTFRLLKIQKDSVMFHHSNVLRDGKILERDIIVSPYGST